MKSTFLIFFSILFCSQVFGQQNTDSCKAISRAKIVTADSQAIDGRDVVISKDSVAYFQKNTQTRVVIDLNRVTRVLEYNGHYGNTGMQIGAIIGGGIGLAVTIGTEKTIKKKYSEETSIQPWPLPVFTVFGALVGYLVGRVWEDWKTVYSKSNGADASLNASLNNIEVEQDNVRGVLVSYNIRF